MQPWTKKPALVVREDSRRSEWKPNHEEEKVYEELDRNSFSLAENLDAATQEAVHFVYGFTYLAFVIRLSNLLSSHNFL